MKNPMSILLSFGIALTAINFAYGQVGTVNSNSQSSEKVSSRKSSNKKRKRKPKFVCELPVSVIDAALSQVVIDLSCSPTDESCEGNRVIKVRTIAVDIEQMKYVYTVSAGKIIGEGAEVEWDLSDAKPGYHTITAAISQPVFDGERWQVLGQIKTKAITIKE